MNKFKYILYLLMYNMNPTTRSVLLLSITYIITKSISTTMYAEGYYEYEQTPVPENRSHVIPSEIAQDFIVVGLIFASLILLGCIIDAFALEVPLEEPTGYVQDFALT